VNREAELDRLSRVACSDLLDDIFTPPITSRNKNADNDKQGYINENGVLCEILGIQATPPPHHQLALDLPFRAEIKGTNKLLNLRRGQNMKLRKSEHCEVAMERD
jgi:hypothetical protein